MVGGEGGGVEGVRWAQLSWQCHAVGLGLGLGFSLLPPPRPRYIPFPTLALHGESPIALQAGGYGAITHPALLSLASPGGSALLPSTPLFSPTQIPPSLPPVYPGLSFLPPPMRMVPSLLGGHRSAVRV